MQKLSVFLLLLWFLFLAACSNHKAERGASATDARATSPRTASTEGGGEKGLSSATATAEEEAPSPAPSADIAFDKKSADKSTDGKIPESKKEAEDVVVVDEVDVENTRQGAGAMTAGEWSDLKEWKFWQKLMRRDEFAAYAKNWNTNTQHRVSVVLRDGSGKPAMDIKVELIKNGKAVFTARTDNKGSAELWAELDKHASQQISFEGYSLRIAEGAQTINNIKRFEDGINELKMPIASSFNAVDIAFVVDATGSMGDELRYLQTELRDVIARASAADKNLKIRTSSVFYRDHGDAYVTRHSDFSDNVEVTRKFISEQKADGGGDFPEAVEEALETATTKLKWSEGSRARLLFLILDAPPHEDTKTQAKFHRASLAAAAQGIKIIPITASGIDKNTEYLMRYLSLITNSTYTFITDHSGIGGSHLEPSIGKYKVEFLNNLMVRLIKQYTS